MLADLWDCAHQRLGGTQGIQLRECDAHDSGTLLNDSRRRSFLFVSQVV